MPTSKTKEFQVTGKNANALFTLKVHRGEGMLLLAMNWKNGKPPDDFVGFSIEYKEPKGDKFFALMNRITFTDKNGKVSVKSISSLQAPFQKFRWFHFPRNSEMEGEFVYKVKPVFMNDKDELSYGESQEAAIQLNRQTYSNKLNVSFTRGFISSQAFIDKYQAGGGTSTLLPAKAKDGLDYIPSHPKSKEALQWMGFEAAKLIMDLLDKAIADKNAEVKVIAYDLNNPEILTRLEKLGSRLQVIVDNSGDHDNSDSAETKAAGCLMISTKGNVKRQHMDQLQHNKIIVINGTKLKAAICGSTNFTWRGFYVQSNNAVVVYGAKAIKPFLDAFKNYWEFDGVAKFGKTSSAAWEDLSLNGINAKVSFSPHAANNAALDEIAKDIKNNTQSNLFYSLAFLYQTKGCIRDTITELTNNSSYFVYGISDKKTGGFDVQKPDGNVIPVYPAELSKNLPEPFKSEPIGGIGTRMHHKFVVIDFDKPTARVYLGSYNFSPTADKKNGENLLLIKDRKIAVSYMIEALRIFDHYHFRVAQKEAKQKKRILSLSRPPRKNGEKTWWEQYYSDKRRIRDREVFA
ncbi:MAG: phospholipase [Ignavibacteriae bacterium]|nr:MAG: phospholipase [Ignavibacteriota bacterium]